MLRRLVGEELDRDRAGGRLENCTILREVGRGFGRERLRLGWRNITNRHARDLDPFGRNAALVRGRLGDLLNDVQALRDAPEDCVIAIAAPVDR